MKPFIKQNQISIILLLFFVLIGCGPSTEEIAAVDYTPLARHDWELSSPAEEGLDAELVDELY